MNLLFPLLLLFISSCASAKTGHYVVCSQDPQKLEARSRELARIVKSDQDERADFQSKTPEEMQEMAKHDLSRRKRVGEFLAKAVFLKPKISQQLL